MDRARGFRMNRKVWESYALKTRNSVQLGNLSTHSTKFCPDRPSARSILKSYKKEIDELLYVMAAERSRSMLLIFQGMDASGKDGVIRHVLTGLNPQHCKVTSFEEPAGEEIAHDYLWRIYRATPAKGQLGAFNRSQYEDVLVPRVHKVLSQADARVRLRQIVDIERIWTENGTVIRKFFLHISRQEQTARFRKRLDDPEKHWKVKESDFADRRLWRRFQSVYEEILTHTSAAAAPWHIIPSDHKWYRDIAVAGIILNAMHDMAPRFPRAKVHRKTLHL